MNGTIFTAANSGVIAACNRTAMDKAIGGRGGFDPITAALSARMRRAILSALICRVAAGYCRTFMNGTVGGRGYLFIVAVAFITRVHSAVITQSRHTVIASRIQTRVCRNSGVWRLFFGVLRITCYWMDGSIHRAVVTLAIINGLL